MSRRPDIDAGALTAAMLQAVTEARAAQTAQEAAGPAVALPLLIEASTAFAKLSRAIRLVMTLVTRPRRFRRAGRQCLSVRAGPGIAPWEWP